MSDCVGAPRMPVCRENYPIVCSAFKSPNNVPIEFAIGKGLFISIRVPELSIPETVTEIEAQNRLQ